MFAVDSRFGALFPIDLDPLSIEVRAIYSTRP
jgi:hypothetical protein